MTDKETPLALRLAEQDERRAAIMRAEPIYGPELRRLYEVNAELVEALEGLLRCPSGQYDASDAYDNAEIKAHAALTKAKGESNAD